MKVKHQEAFEAELKKEEEKARRPKYQIIREDQGEVEPKETAEIEI